MNLNISSITEDVDWILEAWEYPSNAKVIPFAGRLYHRLGQDQWEQIENDFYAIDLYELQILARRLKNKWIGLQTPRVMLLPI